jgi:hypothetical protein
MFMPNRSADALLAKQTATASAIEIVNAFFAAILISNKGSLANSLMEDIQQSR